MQIIEKPACPILVSYAYTRISEVNHPACYFLLSFIVVTCRCYPTRLVDIISEAKLDLEILLTSIITRFRIGGDPQALCQDNNIVELANAIVLMHREERISLQQILASYPELGDNVIAILQASINGVILLSSLFQSRDLTRTLLLSLWRRIVSEQ